jgi:outer membrane protein OmpA-like peptidoglycan-associated protein
MEVISFMLARRQTGRRAIALAAAVSLCGFAAQVAAQEPTPPEGFALGRFHPAPAGDRMFGVQSPFTAGEQAFHVMLLADYAQNPLVVRTADGNEDRGSIVASQLLLHLNGSLALWHRITVNVDVPLALQSGDDATQAGGSTLAAPSGAAIGDLRLAARGTLYGGYFDPFQLAIGGYMWLPTGDPDAYAGDGSVRGAPQIIVGGLIERTVWSFAVGPEFRASKDFANVEQGTMLQWGAGVGFIVDPERKLQVGPELTGSIVLGDVQQRTTNLEALFGGRYRISESFEAGFGVGPGFTGGVGTPEFRAVAMVAVTPEMKPPAFDRDHDGIADAKDACPDVKGVADPDPKKNGCPPRPPKDTDGDGIIDAKDACPDVKGVADPDPKKNGCLPPKDTDGDTIVDPSDACPTVPGVADPDPKKNGCPPPDRDGDKVPDSADACPDIPGVATSDPATNGCPPDTDGDGIRDDKDACPQEKGKEDPDPKKNGCPVGVRVTDTEIVILQQVQFDTGRATIRPVSFPLLDEVAGVLKDHPEILKIEVQGHTDIRGARAYNLKLSQNRADSVMKALAQRGITVERMQAKGLGPDVPVGDNKTEAGRQQNRRVQFNILEKAKKQQ